MCNRVYEKEYRELKSSDVWKIWIDVNNWPKWHSDLEYCKLEGDFSIGSHFILKPKGINAVKIEIVDIEYGRSFTDCTSFFGAKMYDTHYMELNSGSVKIGNKLVMKGPLKWLWYFLVGRNVANSAPKEIESLVNTIRG